MLDETVDFWAFFVRKQQHRISFQFIQKILEIQFQENFNGRIYETSRGVSTRFSSSFGAKSKLNWSKIPTQFIKDSSARDSCYEPSVCGANRNGPDRIVFFVESAQAGTKKY